MEELGIALVILGGISGTLAAGVLLGWPWSLAVGGVLLVVAGVVLIRTAALTPPKVEKLEGGEEQ